MRSATNRVPVLARLLPCTLVLGCAALLGLPTSASAGTILQFRPTTHPGFRLGGVFGLYAHIDHQRGAIQPIDPDVNPDLGHASRGCSDSFEPPAFETFVA